MDIFSTGCVIAEILENDGKSLFNLENLIKTYRRRIDVDQHGEHLKNIKEEIEKAVKEITSDVDIQKLLVKMLDQNPSKRPKINECL